MDRRQPIYSTREDDPELQERIDDFVVDLAQQVDGLQDAEAGGNLDELARLAGVLGDEARELGYPELADTCEAVRQACIERKPEPTQEGLVELTSLAQRIRQAHRGAA